MPSGPVSHFGTRAGLVNASKTRCRGASTTRVMTISRSLGVAYVVTPVLAVVTIGVLPLELFEVVVQPGVARIPESPEFRGPFHHFPERRGVEGAGTPLRLTALLHQTGALE